MPIKADPAHPSHPQTIAHIRRVQHYLNHVINEFEGRRDTHDDSKLVSPEVEFFDKVFNVRSIHPYNSPEYKAVLAEIVPALEHHYAHNDHHPQFYGERGIHGMGLVQLLEMLVDWKAAGEQDNGCVFRSIEINATRRFKYSDELKNILVNTAKWFGWAPSPTEPSEVYLNGVLTEDFYTIYNSLKFNTPLTGGTSVRIVIKCFDIDYDLGPAPNDTDTLIYNHLLPSIVQISNKPPELS